MPHNVFICWAGPLSRSIATVLHEWLPTVIQAVEPFMSEKDIDAGDRGLSEIAGQLQELKIGLICVTASNQSSPWLNYEAGALSKVIEDSRVIPLAFDLEKAQILNPLGQFQAKRFNDEEMFQTVKSINRALGTPLTEARLETAFRIAWPDLSTRIENLRTQESQQTLIDEPRRTIEDMLEELVVASREQSTLLRGPNVRPIRTPAMQAQVVASEAALRRISEIYSLSPPLTLKRFTEMAEFFDRHDWDIVETAPFLVFYLERYFNVTRPEHPGAEVNDEEGDVPF
jgi:hypothetical protein